MNARMNASPLVVLLAATLFACSSSSSTPGIGGGGTPGSAIEASSYDQACAMDAECVGVYSGDACAVCHCPNDAVSSGVSVQYQNDLTAKEATCATKPVCTLARTMPPVHCVSGTCKSG